MADIFYLVIGVTGFIVMVIVMLKSKDEAGQAQTARRKDAMETLEATRKRVQSKQGKIIDPENLPPDVMLHILNKDSDSDAGKMAGSLKKMLD